MYTCWEIWKDRNKMVFANDVFLPGTVALMVVVVVKEIWLSKIELFTSLTIANL